MQLMPATARQVARGLGVPYRRAKLFEPEYNVMLGSHYYEQLLKRFDGHRPKALASYNAGPHRVDRWIDSDIAVDQWIDSLPFKETREYVQAVLAYTVIYRARAGQTAPVLTRDEWSLSH
jgi:soluble lytic murein transglycosylase